MPDQNCDLQLADLRRYASQRLNRAYEYVDEGVSGTQCRRSALDNLMKDAQRRMFDVVLVWKSDRFARSLKHLMESLEEFGTMGIDFVSFTEGIDTTTPSGQLLFHIVGAVAQFERDLIAERVRAGLAHARAMGKHIGRPRATVDVPQVRLLRTVGCRFEISRTHWAFRCHVCDELLSKFRKTQLPTKQGTPGRSFSWPVWVSLTS